MASCMASALRGVVCHAFVAWQSPTAAHSVSFAHSVAARAMGHAALLISLAELFYIALCLASVSFACGTPMTLLTTLKSLLFNVFLGIASGKRVRDQPSL